ncbi:MULTISPECIES: hypothetical protein [unclassified Brenneria]|nr:hypothetical protein [Brenneria sp. hezel4-2-4]MEE3649908.1 hypothetical protein [Brenneria sp. HEZEL_4_2_4]NPC99866.1 hypothetical protein [Brenneria sp. hezel4-2-4]
MNDGTPSAASVKTPLTGILLEMVDNQLIKCKKADVCERLLSLKWLT